jgi:hypothetical protein
MIHLSDYIFEQVVNSSEVFIQHPQILEYIIFVGCMCVVMVINTFLPDFWNKHFKLERNKMTQKRKFTSTGLLIDELETNNK